MEKKQLVKYFYEVIVSNNLLDELSQYISEKCVHCGMCVNQKILRGGCMMDKYLRKKDKKMRINGHRGRAYGV